ncbi:MAG: hypothetical protein AAGC47_10085 [Bacteroidota bacterium]
MKSLFLLFISFLISISLLGQKNQVQITYLPSFSNTLESSYSLESFPARVYDFSPVLTHSFSAKYLRKLNNDNRLSLGGGILNTGFEEEFSFDPPQLSGGVTTEFRATYLSIPIEYLINRGKLEIGVGISANFIIDQTTTTSGSMPLGLGVGDPEPIIDSFEDFAFGLGVSANYLIEVSEKWGIVTGIRCDYFTPINQINAALNLGLRLTL